MTACLVTQSKYGRMVAARPLSPDGRIRGTFLLRGLVHQTRTSSTVHATVHEDDLRSCECGCAGSYVVQEGS